MYWLFSLTILVIQFLFLSVGDIGRNITDNPALVLLRNLINFPMLSSGVPNVTFVISSFQTSLINLSEVLSPMTNFISKYSKQIFRSNYYAQTSNVRNHPKAVVIYVNISLLIIKGHFL